MVTVVSVGFFQNFNFVPDWCPEMGFLNLILLIIDLGANFRLREKEIMSSCLGQALVENNVKKDLTQVTGTTTKHLLNFILIL